jgi:hypothetical protein
MDRREALKGLVAGIPALAGAGALEVTDRTKALILTVREGYSEDRKDLIEALEMVRRRLKDAGCDHVQVTVLYGMDAHPIQ